MRWKLALGLLLVAAVSSVVALAARGVTAGPIAFNPDPCATGSARDVAERAREERAREREAGEREREGRRAPSFASALAEACNESAALQAPGDAMLARELTGSDPDASPERFYRRAVAQRAKLIRATAAQAPAASSVDWNMIGPVNVGARVLDIALDPDNKDTIFIAAASGGVWRSSDRGKTFTSVWPDDLPQSIGALVMTPSGRLIAATGESGPGGGSLTYGGAGVFASDDRGATWQPLGLEKTSRIGRVVVDPKDEQRIFVAASGSLYKPGGDRGLYRTTDGGKSWKLVLKGANATTGAIDVAIDPKDPKRMIAALWDHQRTPDVRRYSGTGSSVWRSLDGGDTWTQIGPPVLLNSNPLLGRIGVAIAPSNPDRIYVIASGLVGGFAGFYVSDDFGSTFVPRVDANLAAGPLTYGWWFGRIWVDPENPDRLFVAGLDLLESTDAGVSFGSSTAGMHPDQHALVFDRRTKGRIYVGNDGGVYRSDDDGQDWDGGKYQPWTQPYSVDVAEDDERRIVAGLQDNGDVQSNPKNTQQWTFYGPGGDGTETKINPKNHDIVYGCSQNGACAVSHDGGTTSTSFENQVISSRKGWLTPIEFDPANPSTVYTGGEILSRSNDDGATWLPISPDLTNGPGTETNPLYAGSYGTITTVSPGASEGGTIYVGTDDGNLWYTHSGGGLTGWTKADDPDLPHAWVTRVQIDPKDDNTVYATYSGFRSGDDAAYLVKSTDGGKSWANITGDLPRIPLNDVNVVGGTLVVASDVGVFASKDGGGHWYAVGRGLPISPVMELRVNAKSGQLFAASFGRSVWKVGLAALAGLPKPKLALSPAKRSCRRPRVLALRLRASRGTTIASAVVTVNGRRAARVRGARARRTIRLAVPRGKLKVAVTATATTGTKLRASKRYPACR